jgi:hypothetical protein
VALENRTNQRMLGEALDLHQNGRLAEADSSVFP